MAWTGGGHTPFVDGQAADGRFKGGRAALVGLYDRTCLTDNTTFPHLPPTPAAHFFCHPTAPPLHSRCTFCPLQLYDLLPISATSSLVLPLCACLTTLQVPHTTWVGLPLPPPPSTRLPRAPPPLAHTRARTTLHTYLWQAGLTWGRFNTCASPWVENSSPFPHAMVHLSAHPSQVNFLLDSAAVEHTHH